MVLLVRETLREVVASSPDEKELKRAEARLAALLAAAPTLLLNSLVSHTFYLVRSNS